MMTRHPKTRDAARGHWRGILGHFGLSKEALSGRHGPCPLCGGRDRFRFDDKEGRGTYFCNQCGAGDGLDLAVALSGRPFPSVAREIDELLGTVPATPNASVRHLDTGDAERILRETLAASEPLQTHHLGHRYLGARGLGEVLYPDALRFAPRLRDGEGGSRPCLIAQVGLLGPDGKPLFATAHRTFLRPDGLAKAEMKAPRKLLPGRLPPGACVPLTRWTGGPLGIAEGLETAMAASALFTVPVWSALNANQLMTFAPPRDAEEVIIFSDNDETGVGQRAAETLAATLRQKGFAAQVIIPSTPGEDWADVWMREPLAEERAREARELWPSQQSTARTHRGRGAVQGHGSSAEGGHVRAG